MERFKATNAKNNQIHGCTWLTKTEQVGNINCMQGNICSSERVISVNRPARFPRPWKAAIGTRSSESPMLQITINTISSSHRTLNQNSSEQRNVILPLLLHVIFLQF